MKNKLILDCFLKVNTSNREAVIFIKANPPGHELSAIYLGHYRVDIKRHLHKEMKGIDRLVRKLID